MMFLCLLSCTDKTEETAMVNLPNESTISDLPQEDILEKEEETYEFDSPKISSVENQEDGVKIKWKSIEGVEVYRVFKKNEKNEWEIIGDTTENFFIDENVESKKEYTYSIRCIEKDSDEYLSNWDEEGKKCCI